jgi:hypothetical protein
MEKYLFSDGTNVVREVQSKEELQSLIQSAVDPSRIRIWLFNSSEWISLADFNKRNVPSVRVNSKAVPAEELKEQTQHHRRPGISKFTKRVVIATAGVLVILLIYNFTRVTWKKTSPATIYAARPENTPVVNIDSLFWSIENLRGNTLDKVTRTNLRIRNTWPELLQLQLTADRDTSREGLRFYNMELIVDNATGYNMDNAVVKLTAWKDNSVSYSDTLRFSNIGYAMPARRSVEGVYKADSISVSFSSIKAKSFNFCYSADKKSNYGNYNDRWFCR